MSYLTVVLYNGLCNRLLPLVSALRLAKKSNRVVNVIWGYTPVRSCMTYYGGHCTFQDLFIEPENLIFEKHDIQYSKTYDYYYWLNLDHFVDIKLDGSIYVNYALYTLISEEDDTDVFKNFKQTLKKTGELIFDRVGEELSMEIKALRPIPELQNEIPNMIGLHLRTSDGDFTKINWKSIIKKLILSCKKWCSQDQKRGVFLATDNSEVFIEFASSLSSKLIIYNPPSVLGGNVSSNKFNNDKYNVLVAVVELFLLGKCNEKIIGTCESTFSAVGMLLAENTVKKYLINDEDSIPDF